MVAVRGSRVSHFCREHLAETPGTQEGTAQASESPDEFHLKKQRMKSTFVLLCLLLGGVFPLTRGNNSDSSNMTSEVSATARSLSELALTTVASPSTQVSGPPALFFSDLNNGPSTGNTDTSLQQTPGQEGAIVTIWGARLGSSQGGSQVFCNGAPAARVYFWGTANLDNYEKVVFQISHSAASGPGQVTVTVNGASSNLLPFTVRQGKIYFVTTTGKDANRGVYSSPWGTLLKARNSMQPGDIVYAMNGVSQTTDDGEGWDAAFLLRGPWCDAQGYPRALVSYPGSTVTIGNANGISPTSGLRTTDFSGHPCGGNWVFAGLRFRGLAPVGVNGPSSKWRFVGNDISCPHARASGGGACFETSLAADVKFYGNVVHDAGAADASALFQGVYFSSDSNHVDMGWNTIYNVHGCRGVQIHSSPLGSNYPNSGFNMYDISIHDNLIHDTQCDGIVLDTIDPSKGGVSVFNNVIYNAGKGPNNPEQTGSWSCINVRGTTEKDGTGGGTVEIYNNTLYSCGTFANPPYSAANAGLIGGGEANLYVHLQSNIFYQVSTSLFPRGVPYLVLWDTSKPGRARVCAPKDDCSRVHGSNNLFFGSGPMGTNLANIMSSLNEDPQFANLPGYDFHLRAGSPAAAAGVPTPLARDHDGIPVLREKGYPIGAYGYVN